MEVPFTEAPLTAESIERFKAQGFLQAPIVEAPTGTWSGYNPGALSALKGLDLG